jgi:hypothetical protein
MDTMQTFRSLVEGSLRHAKGVRRAVGPLGLAVMLALMLAAGDGAATEVTVAGTSTTSLDTITGTAPDILLSKTVFLLVSSDCAVTASSDTLNPLNGDNNLYIFGLNVDDTTTTKAGSNRVIDYDNLSVNEEPNRQPVTSTFVFGSLSGNTNHTFYWSARKFDTNDANMVVGSSSMSIVCSDY